LLDDHFRGKKGHGLVSEHRYALEEELTGKDVDQKLPLALSFRRGIKVNMSMVFRVDEASDDATTGPRCKIAYELSDKTTMVSTTYHHVAF
jgi:hypothetical protein